MSDQIPPQEPLNDPTNPEGSDAGPVKPQRAGHVDVSDRDSLIGQDSASRSLIDAMRITYRLLMIGMVALLGVYLLSGFQPIDEGRRGVRTLFGKITASDLGSGVQFAFPPPFGEIVKVPTGTQTIRIDQAFFPRLGANDQGKPVNELANRGRQSLDPAVDGSMITADRNLAHARWEVVFRRTDPKRLLESVSRESELAIVDAIVRRAVVQVIAEVEIDDLLKQAQGEAGSVVNRVRRVAQASLDSIEVNGQAGLGIEIERVDLLDKAPPLTLLNAFASVQSAQSTANQSVEQARATAQSELNRTAGRASDVLIELIDQYEREIEIDDRAGSDVTLSQIQAVLTGESVEIPSDEGTRTIAQGLVSGEVTEILDIAQAEGDALVTRARGDLSIFRAKREQLLSNPVVAKRRAWTTAYQTLLSSPTLETMMVPPGTSLIELLLNQDPQLRREQEIIGKRREIEEANQERLRELRSERQELRSRTESPDQ